MKKCLLLVGEQSLLKLKLTSILSRTSAVFSANTLEDAMDYFSSTPVTHIVLCDRLASDPELDAVRQTGVRVICLISHDSVADKQSISKEHGILQIVYDQLYGFSGYDTSNTMVLQLQKRENGLVHPALVDDVAFWLSGNVNAEGLFYLRGPDTMGREAFLQALAMETPVCATLPELADETFPGTVVLLRHSLAEGIDVVRHQWTCSVNLIYKMPLHATVAGITVKMFRQQLGQLAAQCLPEEVLSRLDCICPIPNSGIAYAQGVANATGLPLIHAVKKQTASRCFHIENAELRKQMISKSMWIDRDCVRGKRICLVDEAIFTGATLKLLCNMLRACGAAEIHVLIPTPPCTTQCQYCSIPTRPMLLETIPKEILARELDADSVTFQERSVFSNILVKTGMTCCECFS